MGYGTREMKTFTLGLSGYGRVLKIITIFINLNKCKFKYTYHSSKIILNNSSY